MNIEHLINFIGSLTPQDREQLGDALCVMRRQDALGEPILDEQEKQLVKERRLIEAIRHLRLRSGTMSLGEAKKAVERYSQTYIG